MTTKAELLQADKDRLSALREIHGDQFLAERKARVTGAWYKFTTKHSGLRAINNSEVFFVCQANVNLLTAYIKEEMGDPEITFLALENAFNLNQHRLAKAPAAEYVRKCADPSGILPQRPLILDQPPEVTLPYTREMVLAMSAYELRKIMARGLPFSRALDRILQGRD
jgi:hypothetical protein